MKGNCVTVEWRVKNTGEGRMYFSIGGHPGFCVDRQIGARLVFEGQESLTRIAIDPATAGADADHPEILRLEEGRYQVGEHTFDRDALIFDGGQVKQVSLENPLPGAGGDSGRQADRDHALSGRPFRGNLVAVRDAGPLYLSGAVDWKMRQQRLFRGIKG